MSDEITYALTAAELRRGLWKIRRPLSRLVPQTVLLLLIGLPSLWYACFRDGDSGTWLLGIALPLLAAAVWVLPAVSFRREAAAQAALGLSITLTLTETALSVGGATQPLTEAALTAEGNLILWKIDRDQWIVIPHRVLYDEQWQRLTAHAA